MNPDDTLNTIDAALEGWSDYDDIVSPDAMRWAPEKPEAAITSTVGADFAGDTVHWHRDVPLTHEQIRQTIAAVSRSVEQQQASLLAGMRLVATHASKAIHRVHAGAAPLVYGDDYRRHRRRCRVCNPAGNPKPLKVNGADYTRRRKNRRRRG